MKMYIGKCMTSEIDALNLRLSPEVLQTIIERQPKVPVVVNFDSKNVVGRVTEFTKKGDEVFCQFNLIKPLAFLEESYIVPDLIVNRYHIDNHVVIVDQAGLATMSITLIPADGKLTPIELQPPADEPEDN